MENSAFKWLHECLYQPFYFDPYSLEKIYTCDLCHNVVKSEMYIRRDILSYSCKECYDAMFATKDRVT
jgi:hypothetical protein